MGRDAIGEDGVAFWGSESVWEDRTGDKVPHESHQTRDILQVTSE